MGQYDLADMEVVNSCDISLVVRQQFEDECAARCYSARRAIPDQTDGQRPFLTCRQQLDNKTYIQNVVRRVFVRSSLRNNKR